MTDTYIPVVAREDTPTLQPTDVTVPSAHDSMQPLVIHNDSHDMLKSNKACRSMPSLDILQENPKPYPESCQSSPRSVASIQSRDSDIEKPVSSISLAAFATTAFSNLRVLENAQLNEEGKKMMHQELMQTWRDDSSLQAQVASWNLPDTWSWEIFAWQCLCSRKFLVKVCLSTVHYHIKTFVYFSFDGSCNQTWTFAFSISTGIHFQNCILDEALYAWNWWIP